MGPGQPTPKGRGAPATATAAAGVAPAPEATAWVIETVVSPFHCLYQDALEFHQQSLVRQRQSEAEASRMARAALLLYLSAAESLVHQAAAELGNPALTRRLADASHPLPLGEVWALLPPLLGAGTAGFDPDTPPWPQFAELLGVRDAWLYPGPASRRCAYYRAPYPNASYDPLQPHQVPPGRADGAPWMATAEVRHGPDLAPLEAVLRGARRGIVVAGAEPGAPAGGARSVAQVAPRLAGALGWPLLLDARVRGAVGAGGATVVGAADALLRDPEVAAALRPDVVVHLGAPVASRVVGEWIGAADAVEVRVGAHGWVDPAHRTALRVAVPAAALVDGPAVLAAPATEPGWADRWGRAEEAARAAVEAALSVEAADDAAPTEPGTARTVLGALQDGEALVVSSSMPIRDLEWYGCPRGGVAVHANRGANGIDGVVSTAVGVALATGGPTACLVGDVALLHDANALIGVARRGIDLTVVVVDNDGGGIFSFLPQAADPGGAAFEDLFGTPHGVDLRVLAAAHGLITIEPAVASEVGPAVRASLDTGGVRLVRVVTDRVANVEVHRRIHAAVATAARDALDLP